MDRNKQRELLEKIVRKSYLGDTITGVIDAILDAGFIHKDSVSEAVISKIKTLEQLSNNAKNLGIFYTKDGGDEVALWNLTTHAIPVIIDELAKALSQGDITEG